MNSEGNEAQIHIPNAFHLRQLPFKSAASVFNFLHRQS
jgi:hypothetical protein